MSGINDDRHDNEAREESRIGLALGHRPRVPTQVCPSPPSCPRTLLDSGKGSLHSSLVVMSAIT